MSQNNVDPSERDKEVDPSEGNRTGGTRSEGGENPGVDPSERGTGGGGGSQGGDRPGSAGGINPVQHSE